MRHRTTRPLPKHALSCSLRQRVSARRLGLEVLEDRTLLTVAGGMAFGTPDSQTVAVPCSISGAAATSSSDLFASPAVEVDPLGIASPADSAGGGASNLSAPFSPANISQAYGFNSIYFPDGQGGFIKGDGAGQTIAVVIAYQQPNLAADLHAFDQQFGLSDPQLTICNQTGSTATATLPKNATGSWGVEASLDVQWIHALAPAANILVIEASSNSTTNLYQAADTARKAGTGNLSALPYTTVVSMSWGIADFAGDTNGGLFTTPPGKTGVMFVAASGDTGTAGQYPATDPGVLAVGGTTVTINSQGNYSSEVAWSGSSGGFSFNSVPSYQQGVQPYGAQNSGNARMTPDVAFDGDVNSGLYVYDSFDFPSAPWREAGGTSAGAPCWAALLAIADQAAGQSGPLTSSQMLARIYAASSTTGPTYAYHDVTSGANSSYSAGPGYDLVTGLGSPRANVVVAALAGFSETPTPSAPAGNINTLLPTFQWSAIGGATGYYFSLVDTTTHVSVANQLPVSGTTHTLATALTNGDSYQWSVQAYDVSGALGPASSLLSFTTAVVVNHAPTGTSTTVSTPENTAYTFAASDFGFSDPGDSPPNNFLAVSITTLPTAGSILDNGTAVTAGQLIPVTDISQGLLKFVSSVGAIGTPYGIFTFQVEDDGGTANGGHNLDPVPKTMTIDVIAPPQVTQVLVDGSAWSTSFLAALQNAGKGNGGYAIPVGSAAQLQALPWSNLNQIRIVFNENVDVDEDSLTVTGVTGSYSFTGFSYSSTTFTAIWTLATPLGAEKLTIDLQSSGPNAVTDTTGHALDGEWSNQTSSYPSGNGQPGGDFQFAFNVLPGDVNGDGIVNGQDLALVSSTWLSTLPSADLNGDGIVNAQDLGSVSSNWLATLPAGGGGMGAADVMSSSLVTASVVTVLQAPIIDVDPHLVADDVQVSRAAQPLAFHIGPMKPIEPLPLVASGVSAASGALLPVPPTVGSVLPVRTRDTVTTQTAAAAIVSSSDSSISAHQVNRSRSLAAIDFLMAAEVSGGSHDWLKDAFAQDGESLLSRGHSKRPWAGV
jgi:hypothetical protein